MAPLTVHQPLSLGQGCGLNHEILGAEHSCLYEKSKFFQLPEAKDSRLFLLQLGASRAQPLRVDKNTKN